MRTERTENLFSFGGAEGRRAQRARQFRFIQLIVPAQQDQHRLAFGKVNQRLNLSLGRHVVWRAGQGVNSNNARRRKFLDRFLAPRS